MIGALEAEGVHVAVATPTLTDAPPPGLTIELLGRCAELELCAKWARHAVDVEPGALVSQAWALEASSAELLHASIGGHGRDLLVEVPHGRVPDGFEAGIEGLMERGYRVTLAHPEVNGGFQREPARLAALVRRGCLVQVTARALVRAGGKSPSAALARALVAEELCHVLASDARSAGPWRAPDLRRGLLEAATLAGARAEWLVSDAPGAVLEGAPLPPPPTARATPRGLATLRRRAAA
jgi:protein-tyrosine phosphatase